VALQLQPISILAGVDKDNTALSTDHYTDATAIRFYDGKPQKLGGWDQLTFDNDNTINGCPRTIYSQRIANNLWSLIGTNTRLYSLNSTQLTNITPLVTATTAIANSLATNYTTLANNPFATTNGSATVTVTHTSHKLLAGDSVTYSGSAAVNGIPAGDFNTTMLVRSVINANSYTIRTTTAASGTGSGGGAAVIEKTALITVSQAAHGFADGDRVGILAAASTGGVPNTEINAEHIIRNVSVNAYSFMCTTKATSSVSGSGGAATTVQGQIAAGACDASFGRGYGMGRYGVGRYGVSKTSSALLITPRIYSFDAYGNNIVLTPGNQTGTYVWTGNILTAPTALTNAPTAINYVFVSNNIIITLGASGTPNRIKWSDQGASTVWTATATNQAGEDDIEGAGMFMTYVPVRDGVNLLFTANQVYTFRYIGFPFIWETKKISDTAGIIAQNARVAYNGIAYWIGQDDFWMYNGGVIQSIPSNSASGINYLRRWFFSNMNTGQQSKCFAWFNPKYSEIWFHAPHDDDECDIVVRYNPIERHFTPDVMSRSAAEYPTILQTYPKLINHDGDLFRHEKGLNDVDSALDWSLTGPVIQGLAGDPNDLTEIGGIIPDSIQTGDIDFSCITRLYAQSTSTNGTETVTVAPDTELSTFFSNGRNYQFKWEQNDVLNGNWRMGTWQHWAQKGTYQ
jgi:hypothetical protein